MDRDREQRRVPIQSLARLVFAVVVILGIAYWLTLPSDIVAVGPDCAVIGIEDRIAAWARPRAFWLAQIEALRQAEQIQEQLQADSGYGAAHESDKIETPIERRMDRLSDRADAEATSAQRARLDEIAWMSKCESAIAERLKMQ
jgi:hypothetical protein